MDIEIQIQAAYENFQRGNLELAEEILRKVLAMHPENAVLHNNMGLVLQGMGQYEQAAEYFVRALEIEPSRSDIHYNLGNVFKEKGTLDEAEGSYRKAIDLDPENADAYVNLGLVLKQKGQLEEAAFYYKRALALNPENTDAYINLSIVFKAQGQLTEAISACRKALQIEPANVFALINMGNAFLYQGKYQEAQRCYRETLALDQNLLLAYSNLLCSMNYHSFCSQDNILTEHKKFAELFAVPLSPGTPLSGSRRIHRKKLRIGYLSPDFRQHSVAYFIEPVLSAHDRKSCEVFCYSNVSSPDEVTRRLQGIADKWRNIAGLTDEESARLIRGDGIDILIDLAGHTAGNRILVFARKPAPVQVSWIGYPATTGLSSIDYKIVDRFTDPPGMTEKYYTEKLLRMPDSFLCYLPERESPEINPLPALGNGYITFGSFNNFAKVTPEVMTLWAKILKELSDARLILKANSFADKETCRYALSVFSREGINKSRIALLPSERSVKGHLELYSHIDIALDTFPYNGTTTTCEALWMGVPAIVLEGQSHASRVGMSIIANVGLEGLISATPDEYVKIAVRFAEDLRRLKDLREGMRTLMLQSPVTDARRFTMNLEHYFQAIWNE